MATPRRFLFFLLLLLSGLPRVVCAQGEEGAEVEEYALKAVYLYNFLHFVSWPETGGGERPLTIGVVGHSPFGEAFVSLQQSLNEGKKPSFQLVDFGRYRPGLKLRECNLLFISAGEGRNYQTILRELAGEPVLTVSDGPGFLEAGGMIALLLEQGKIRWAINRSPAQMAGLRFQSQLLKIAVKVIGGPERSERNGSFLWEQRLAGRLWLLPPPGTI